MKKFYFVAFLSIASLDAMARIKPFTCYGQDFIISAQSDRAGNDLLRVRDLSLNKDILRSTVIQNISFNKKTKVWTYSHKNKNNETLFKLIKDLNGYGTFSLGPKKFNINYFQKMFPIVENVNCMDEVLMVDIEERIKEKKRERK